MGTLIASGMLAGMGSQGEKPKKAEDHSWRDILGEQILFLVTALDLDDG